MKLLWAWITGILVTCPALAFAANPDAAMFSFRKLSIQDGLSQNTVLSVFQDKLGFIWIGTYDGLNRYDGRKIITFMPSVNAENSLRSGTVYAISEDDEGMIYLGTYGGGLSVYNPVKSTFTHYSESDSVGKTPLATDFIFSMRKHTDGTIWLAGRGGVSAFDPKTKTFRTWSSRNKRFPSVSATDIIFDSEGRIWAATFGNGLYELNQSSNCFEAVPVNEMEGDIYNNNLINKIEWLGPGKLLLATDGGAYVYDCNNRNYSNYYGIKYSVNSVFVDSRRNVWIGSLSNTLVVITADGIKREILSDRYQSNSIVESAVGTFFEDRSGGLWVGLKTRGVALTNLYKKPFLHLYHNVTLPSIPGNEVFALANGDNGDVWIGTMSGLSLWERSKNNFQNFTVENKQLISNHIWSLCYQGHDSLWIGSDNGLFLFNRKRGILKQYTHSVSNKHSICSNSIACILHDSKGRLWVGTNDGLSVMLPNHQEFTNYRENEGSNLSFNNIWDVFEDRNGRIWVGTEKGLNRLDETSGAFIQYLYNANDEHTLVSNDISTLKQGTDGRIWVCTRMGVCYYDESANCFERLNQPELANKFTYSAMQTGNFLWISTNNGLARIDLAKNAVKFFQSDEGVQSNEFNPPALRLADGYLLFGGINGVTGFYPDKIQEEADKVPSLYFTGLKVDGETIDIENANKSRNHKVLRTIEYASIIKLEPDEKVLTLEFAALEYFAPGKINYFYRILPNSTNWIPLKDQNSVSFVNLNPGNYTLEIRSTNSDGIVVDNIKSIDIVIKPPFWLKAWFIASMLGLLAGLIVLLIRLRFIRLQRNTILLEKEVMERTKKIEVQKREIEIQRNIASHQRDKITEQRDQLERLMQNLEVKVKERTLELELAKFKAEESDRLKSAFLSNMSHEIRTPMNAIIGFSELLLEEGFSEEEKSGFAELIRTNGDHLLNLLNDIIDISMIESGQLKLVPSHIQFNELVNEVWMSFKNHRMLQQKKGKVQVALKPMEQPITLFTDPLRVKQVLFNLISNAIKFTSEGVIEIGYRINASSLQVSVSDTGIGIAPENQKHVFERFRKVDADKRNLYGGFGLGLTISRNLIESLGGRIWLESYSGKGTTFYFTLPLNNRD